MHIEDAIETLEENGLDVFHGSDPHSYRVKVSDDSMVKSIQLRSVDVPTFARIIEKLTDE